MIMMKMMMMMLSFGIYACCSWYNERNFTMHNQVAVLMRLMHWTFRIQFLLISLVSPPPAIISPPLNVTVYHLHHYLLRLFLIWFIGEVHGSLWSNTDTSLTMLNRELEIERERKEKFKKSINRIQDKEIISLNSLSVQSGIKCFYYYWNAQENNHI